MSCACLEVYCRYCVVCPSDSNAFCSVSSMLNLHFRNAIINLVLIFLLLHRTMSSWMIRCLIRTAVRAHCRTIHPAAAHHCPVTMDLHHPAVLVGARRPHISLTLMFQLQGYVACKSLALSTSSVEINLL